MTSLGSILWFLAIGALVFFMMKKGGGCCGGHNHGDHHEPEGADTKKDPVCGMNVPGDTEFTKKHDGTSYHFCSTHCQEQFRQDPKAYLGNAASNRQHH